MTLSHVWRVAAAAHQLAPLRARRWHKRLVWKSTSLDDGTLSSATVAYRANRRAHTRAKIKFGALDINQDFSQDSYDRGRGLSTCLLLAPDDGTCGASVTLPYLSLVRFGGVNSTVQASRAPLLRAYVAARRLSRHCRASGPRDSHHGFPHGSDIGDARLTIFGRCVHDLLKRYRSSRRPYGCGSQLLKIDA